jgi:polysaccharide biosynthesis transport protein
MNVPNLINFDAEGGSARPPSTAAYGARSVANAPYGESANFNAPDEPTSDLRKSFFVYLGLALKYRWLIVVCCALSLGIGFILTYTQTPIYQATVTIQIDKEAARVVKVDTPQDPDSGVDTLRFYQTQYDLLRSRSLAERVATDLDLAAASDFLDPPSTSAWAKLRRLIRPSASTTTGTDNNSGKGNLEQRKAAATGMVLGGLSIAPVPNSTLVRISFDSPTPAWAQRIANGLADSYVKSNLERRYGATAYARNFLKERLDELKLKLEDSEKALVAYAQEKELIGDIKPGGKDQNASQSLAESDLAALNTALETVVADRIHAQELWEQANNSKEIGLPQFLEDKAISTLRGQRAALMADYQNKLSTFKPDYPDMLRLKAQINEIDQEIKSEADVIKQSLKAHYDSALQQEVLLKTKMDEVKRAVLETRNKEIQYNILKREADTNRTLYDGLLQQYKDIGVAGAVGTNNVAVIDRAQLPGAPYKPDLRMSLVKWLMFGLFGAALIIALFEILDDTFKSPEEIEEQLGLAVLGIIPMSDGSVLGDISSPSHPIAEAFRSFRTALQFSTDQGAPKSIVVTSAQPGEGKSTTALALAVNFAQLGMKVLLIDADLRNPSQHRNLGRSNGAGLSNYLAGGAIPESIFRKTDFDGLYFMPSGPLPPNPAELLAGPKMLSLLSTAGEKLDVVIIDSPPVLGLADAPLLASIASGTLLVIAAAYSRRGVVKAALKRLHFSRARMLGALMNKCDFRSNYGYGGYGYGYGTEHAALEYYGYGQKEQLAQVERSPRG